RNKSWASLAPRKRVQDSGLDPTCILSFFPLLLLRAGLLLAGPALFLESAIARITRGKGTVRVERLVAGREGESARPPHRPQPDAIGREILTNSGPGFRPRFERILLPWKRLKHAHQESRKQIAGEQSNHRAAHAVGDGMKGDLGGDHEVGRQPQE